MIGVVIVGSGAALLRIVWAIMFQSSPQPMALPAAIGSQNVIDDFGANRREKAELPPPADYVTPQDGGWVQRKDMEAASVIESTTRNLPQELNSTNDHSDS